jgi:predicted nucleotidyltransferase
MRNPAVLDALFPSVRAALFSVILMQPERWWYMSELARRLGKRPSSLQRELDSLVAAGLLQRRQEGRRAYFKANSESPVFPEMHGLIEKTVGIVPALKDTLKQFGARIELAILYGSVASGEVRAGSDVDILIVGTVKQIDLLPALRKLEARFLREVNVILYSPQEFRRKLAERNHFLRSVLRTRIVPLKGRLDELEEAAARQESPSAPDQPAGANRTSPPSGA